MTTDISSGAGRLIVKAGLHWLNDPTGTRAEQAARRARMTAFGEVADDVFGIAMSPTGFEMAVRASLLTHPRPVLNGAPAAAAKTRRDAWWLAIVEDVLARLRENDPSRGGELAA